MTHGGACEVVDVVRIHKVGETPGRQGLCQFRRVSHQHRKRHLIIAQLPQAPRGIPEAGFGHLYLASGTFTLTRVQSETRDSFSRWCLIFHWVGHSRRLMRGMSFDFLLIVESQKTLCKYAYIQYGR